MSVNDPAALRSYQMTQAQNLTEDLTEAHRPELRSQMAGLRKLYEEMPLQLFIQTMLLTDLLSA